MNFVLQLRKLTAAFLFAVLCLALLQPLFADSSKPQLPACCRNEGKHKCGMAAHDDSPTFRTAPCSEYPRIASQATTTDAAVLPSANNVFALAQRPQVTTRGPQCIARRFTHFVSLRGPPARFQMLPSPRY